MAAPTITADDLRREAREVARTIEGTKRSSVTCLTILVRQGWPVKYQEY